MEPAVPDDSSTNEPISPNEPLSFEQALGELQQVVDELEEGSVGLEESMRRFERGTALLRHCYGLLEHAEQRIEILTGRDAAGNVETAPFDASARTYAHNKTGEDNADAHMKRQVMGREVVVAVTKGELDFGPWEQIFYGEFDGSRPKRVLIKVIGE